MTERKEEGFDEMFLPKTEQKEKMYPIHNHLDSEACGKTCPNFRAQTSTPITSTPTQDSDASPAHCESVKKTARFLTIGRKGVKVSREHIHSPITFIIPARKITVCKECHDILGGDKTE